MPRVLCLDTEPETAKALRSARHTVDEGLIGYRNGRFKQPYPPHEYDAVVSDLIKPACYDADWWGPHKNDNMHCKIVEKPTEKYIRRDGQLTPKFKLIHSGQIVQVGSHNFTGADVLSAVRKAGTNAFLFLNPEWIRHLSYEFPDWLHLGFQLERTVANVVHSTKALQLVLPEFGTDISFKLPLRYFVTYGPLFGTHDGRPRCIRDKNTTTCGDTPLVLNSVDQAFCRAAKFERGSVWALPQFKNNADAMILLLSRLPVLGDVLAPRRTGPTSQPKPATGEELTAKTSVSAATAAVRDVFISHASEDKEAIARPLANALRENGVSVWFDEYELRLGDSLRRRIEEGLRVSRHGLTILSKSFFSKPWPQRELDALVSLETHEKRIMPIWHNLTSEEVRHYSPLLADKLAIPSSAGIDKIVEEVKRALRDVTSSSAAPT